MRDQLLVAQFLKTSKIPTGMKSQLKMLKELESHYEDMLSHVRAMIAAERGQPLKSENRNGATGDDTTQPFSNLSKREAVALILKQKGQMHYGKIFASMRKRGHPIKSKGSLANMLSTDKRFEKKGKGIWGFAETQ